MVFRVKRLLAASLCITCLIATSLAPDAHAMSVTPLAIELSSNGSQNKSTLRVHNDSAAPIPIEIKVSRLSIDEAGEPTNQPENGKFLIFPPQATIAPGSTQSFRVQWAGKPDLQQSESYMFSVNQLPVVMDAGKSGVQIVFNFAVLVNVSPAKSSAVIDLVSTQVVESSKNGRNPLIIVENTGNRHALLGRSNIILRSGDWVKKFSGSQLRDVIGGLGLVQPGKKRRFRLGTDLPPQITRFEAQIELERAR
jgi:P pilus assembly chaperone PapD